VHLHRASLSACPVTVDPRGFASGRESRNEALTGLGRTHAEISSCVVVSGVVDGKEHLRPLERRVRRLVAAGVNPAEVAWRFRRSPRSVYQILKLGSRPSRGVGPPANQEVLRPLERRILAWREAGASYAEIGARFRRSPLFIHRVEDLARAKLARAQMDAK
jgi:DNA-binding CsgD family transcriptional regulator